MMLFDADGKIKRYDSPEDILTEFFGLRLQYYERRRVSLLQVGAARAGGVRRRGSAPRPREPGGSCQRDLPNRWQPCS